MDFYCDWAHNMNNSLFIMNFLTKTNGSRRVFREGTEDEVRRACDLLKNISMKTFIDALQNVPFDRLPDTEEIPQCGSFEKAICEVPQVLAFYPNGLTCSELGLKLGAETQGDAPRKSGEGNGKFAASLDLAIRLQLPIDNGKGTKYGYKLSSLGRQLLVYSKLEDKLDIISRLLVREYIIQMLIFRSMNGYCSYSEAVASLKSRQTRMRRRQNVRRIIDIIDSQLGNEITFFDKIDWEV